MTHGDHRDTWYIMIQGKCPAIEPSLMFIHFYWFPGTICSNLVSTLSLSPGAYCYCSSPDSSLNASISGSQNLPARDREDTISKIAGEETLHAGEHGNTCFRMFWSMTLAELCKQQSYSITSSEHFRCTVSWRSSLGRRAFFHSLAMKHVQMRGANVCRRLTAFHFPRLFESHFNRSSFDIVNPRSSQVYSFVSGDCYRWCPRPSLAGQLRLALVP